MRLLLFFGFHLKGKMGKSRGFYKMEKKHFQEHDLEGDEDLEIHLKEFLSFEVKFIELKFIFA